ncbi:MAG: beta-hydroxyacyl-ACP dehydratase [Desulfobacterales bacterium]|nr:beta-hydroxyacyl-ACP dehydratase [Desulfobacterales bacterium]
MVVERDIKEKILELIPQKSPFRFIDDILEIDEKGIISTYRFRKDEYFYQGHFPGNPITPGVILIEAMAQTGVVAMGIFLLMQQGVSFDAIKQMTTLFAFVDDVEFTGIVYPCETIIIKGEKQYFRKKNLKTTVSIERENGDNVCMGVLTGTGVTLNAK